MDDGADSPGDDASLDDPDWVEQMLARALDSASSDTAAQDPPAESQPRAVEPAAPLESAPPPQSAPPDRPKEPVSDPYLPAPADEAAWSTWAAGGSAPAASEATTSPTAAPSWSEQQTAAIPQAPPASVIVDGDHEIEYEVVDAPKHKSRVRSLAEWGAVVVGAIVIALLVKTFLFQAFYIPSGSMEPTLAKNDRVLVNKLSYDLHDVNRGDIVVFKRPPEEQGDIEDLIKRVIALPGETITFRDGVVFIDDHQVIEPYTAEPDSTDNFLETIPNCEGSTPSGCTVPEGRVFVMGDNRRDSRDSRFFGPIAESSIVGRAFMKIWPVTDIGFL